MGIHPARSSHKLGLVVSSDSVKINVTDGVEKDSENVGEKFSRKRKVAAVVKLENKEESAEVVLIPDLNQLADDEKLSPGTKETQDIVSEGNVGIELKEGNVNGRTTRWRRFSREDKNKGVSVVDVEQDDMEIDLGKDIDIGDKGKGKLVEVDLSSNDSGPDNMDEDFVLGTRCGFMGAAADAGILAIGRASTSSSRMRERFKNAARKNAMRFAYFSHQQEEEELDIDDDDEDEPELPQTEANVDEEDWPGPFSTAMKIINDRTANMAPILLLVNPHRLSLKSNR
ncbi:hypothetical protein Tco_1113832 [Tanacetum coccineum]|uniref:Uncharacterized protein n=1 Tax=Tanacetum coccineum TaxID=301880 RepID=A0ABQ5IX10_9ASTR